MHIVSKFLSTTYGIHKLWINSKKKYRNLTVVKLDRHKFNQLIKANITNKGTK